MTYWIRVAVLTGAGCLMAGAALAQLQAPVPNQPPPMQTAPDEPDKLRQVPTQPKPPAEGFAPGAAGYKNSGAAGYNPQGTSKSSRSTRSGKGSSSSGRGR